MSARLISALAAALCLTPTGASFADFRVCNKSKEQVYVAFGYEAARDRWVAEGWWTLKRGACSTVWSGNLKHRYYYLYAEGDDGTEWEASEGGEGSNFCIKKEKFKLDQKQYGKSEEDECKKHGLYSKAFFQVDVSQYDSWTHTLDPATDAAAPPPPAPSPKPGEGTRPGGTACERYPNLC